MANKLYGAIATAVLVLCMSFAASADSVPRMSADELKAHLGDDGPLILDVRASRDWTGSSDKIVGAERVEPGNVNQWGDNYAKEKPIVLYCA